MMAGGRGLGPPPPRNNLEVGVQGGVVVSDIESFRPQIEARFHHHVEDNPDSVSIYVLASLEGTALNARNGALNYAAPLIGSGLRFPISWSPLNGSPWSPLTDARLCPEVGVRIGPAFTDKEGSQFLVRLEGALVLVGSREFPLALDIVRVGLNGFAQNQDEGKFSPDNITIASGLRLIF